MREFENRKKNVLKKKDIKITKYAIIPMGLLFFHLNLYLCAIDIGSTK